MSGEEPGCRYPCDCGQFPDEHCACMDGHAPAAPQTDVRLTEAERDAAVDRLCDGLHKWREDAEHYRARAEHYRARAESAEAAHRALQAAVEALADEWAEDYPGPTAACSRTPDEWARDLRALLAGGEER